MISLILCLNELGWPDLAGREIIHVTTPLHIAGLSAGMESGKPSVMLRVDLPDGRVVLTETSLALFLTAADGLKARFGDPRFQDTPAHHHPLTNLRRHEHGR